MRAIAFLILLIHPAGSHVNILHIVIDDLRTEISAYNPGHKIFTPSIDALAKEGVIFDRAYAQLPVCNPSRSSFMTGRRPDTTQIWNLEDNWRVKHQDWTSLPGMFKKSGFKSLGTGKTYHDTVQSGNIEDAIFQYDGRRSWSDEALPYRNPCFYEGVNCLGCPSTHWTINDVSEDWCIREEGDFSDVLTIKHALELLQIAVDASTNQSNPTPFYLAVGLHKPHMPWIAKQEHFDLYPLENITLTKIPTLDKSIPQIAYAGCDSPTPYEAIPDYQAKLARRAYYAATTGMDEQVGYLLEALRTSGVADSTAILLHGDHGWHLGDRGEWRKNTNWDASLRTPLIVKVPWMTGLAGTRTSALAELVDIMPTLAALADVSLPSVNLGDRLYPPEGTSLLPLMQMVAAQNNANYNANANAHAHAHAHAHANTTTSTSTSGSDSISSSVGVGVSTGNNYMETSPARAKEEVGVAVTVDPLAVQEKMAAFSQTARCPSNEMVPWENNGCDHHSAEAMGWMGYSVRVAEWRYTEWRRWNGTTLCVTWSDHDGGTDPVEKELYDHREEDATFTNYDLSEIVNVVHEVENAHVVLHLANLLKGQFYRPLKKGV